MAVEDYLASAKGGCTADDGADVAGILHAFEEDRRTIAAQVRQHDFGGDAGRCARIGDGGEGARRKHQRLLARAARERRDLAVR